MNLKAEIEEYETLPFELVGKRIEKISYFEIDYGEPAFELNDYHSLDYGLQIETIDNQAYYLIWDSQKIQYDLKFKKGQLIDEFNSESKIKCYDVSSLTHWTDRIGEKIKNVKSYWSYVQTVGEKEKEYYPQDLELTFENGLNVIFSALEINPDGQIYGMADHVSVFFDSEIAKKYGAKNELLTG